MEENNILLKSFLERTFFKSWKTHAPELENFRGIELMVNGSCDLGCSYCYIHKYGNQLFPPETRDKEKILSNTDIILKWLEKNEYKPSVDIFGGEIFSQDIGMAVFERSSKANVAEIVIPTNMNFLLDDKRTKQVFSIIDKASVPVYLSASVDGIYMEENRSFHNKEKRRDEKFYHKLFSVAKERGYGFHPMVYSNRIEHWIENFLWFQEMFKKYKLNPLSIYLLEVRNAEWTVKQCQEFSKFIEFLVDWLFEYSNRNKNKFIENLFRGRGFNILSNSFTTIGRGMGCSVQSQLYVRLGDLAIVPCHRTMYKPYIYGWFDVENGEIKGVRANNLEIMFSIFSMDRENFPKCECCANKYFCSSGCLGSQFETTGDMFSPIPTVCMMEHAKTIALLKSLEKIGVLSELIMRLSPMKAKAVNFFTGEVL